MRPESSLWEAITAEKNRKMGGRKKEEKEMKRFSRLVAAMVALALVLTGVVFAETQGTMRSGIRTRFRGWNVT